MAAFLVNHPYFTVLRGFRSSSPNGNACIRNAKTKVNLNQQKGEIQKYLVTVSPPHSFHRVPSHVPHLVHTLLRSYSIGRIEGPTLKRTLP